MISQEASPPGHPHEQHWAVIGGGMLGLTLAYRLAQDGQRVTIIEGAERLGGLADAWTLGDITWDRHYHVTLLSDTHLRHLLAELGLEREMRWVETKTGFYTDGQLLSMSNSWEFLRFPPISLLDKLRLAATIFFASKYPHWQQLERIPVEKWLKRWSGANVFEKIWRPLLRAKLGAAHQRTSAAFIWGTIQRMYRARRTGMKKEMFGYCPGGYDRIVRHFEDVLRSNGVEICVGQPLKQLESLGKRRGVQVQLADGSVRDFDRAVLTIPSSVIERVCPQLSATEREQHRSIEYLGIICASVLLRRPLAEYYVTNITDESIPLTGVIEMTNVVQPADLRGHTLVYLPKYVTSDDPALEWTDEEVRKQFLGSLARMYPGFDPSDVLAFRISRVRYVMAIPTLNYSKRLPPMETSIPGVYAINSAHIVKGSLNVNETVELAERAFYRMLRPTLCNPAVPAQLPPSGIEEPNEEAACELVARP